LRFAASQWQQLVSNAECLLNELVAKGSLAGDTQNRIESWLCLKEEYQHCIDPDLYAMKPRIKNQADSNGNHSTNAPTTVLDHPKIGDSKTLHVIGNSFRSAQIQLYPPKIRFQNYNVSICDVLVN